MRHGSLFSGIGGFDLAAEWMDWENVFQCEIDGFCQKVLEKNFPNVKRYGDITKTDFTIHRGTIDVLSGGFPCQPFSQAGKRKGKSDDRFIWGEMLRAIREINPVHIVAENVYGITNQGGGLVFEQVCSEMEDEGYEVQPVIIPACSVNAPHRRDRVWFIAYSDSNGRDRCNSKNEVNPSQGGELALCNLQQVFSLSDTFINGLQGNTPEPQARMLPDRLFTSERWENDSCESPICRVVDGVPNRVDRIKALGNAIVPQVAFEIFKAIESVNLKTA